MREYRAHDDTRTEPGAEPHRPSGFCSHRRWRAPIPPWGLEEAPETSRCIVSARREVGGPVIPSIYLYSPMCVRTVIHNVKRSESPPYRISVVIPTYQRRASVQRALRALSRQTLQPEYYEVIVAIDGSTDGT